MRADSFLLQNKLDPLYEGAVVSAATRLGRVMRGRGEDGKPIGVHFGRQSLSEQSTHR